MRYQILFIFCILVSGLRSQACDYTLRIGNSVLNLEQKNNIGNESGTIILNIKNSSTDTIDIPDLIRTTGGVSVVDPFDGKELYSIKSQDTVKYVVPDTILTINNKSCAPYIKINDEFITPDESNALLIKKDQTLIALCKEICPDIIDDEKLYIRTIKFTHNSKAFIIHANILLTRY